MSYRSPRLETSVWSRASSLQPRCGDFFADATSSQCITTPAPNTQTQDAKTLKPRGERLASLLLGSPYALNVNETSGSSRRLGRASTRSACEKESAMGRLVESPSAGAGGLGQCLRELGSGSRA